MIRDPSLPRSATVTVRPLASVTVATTITALPRMPFGPLEAVMRSAWAGPESGNHPPTFSPRAAALRLDVNVLTIHRWRREGIPWWTADRLAVRLNTHPSLIWPDYWTVET